MKLPRYALIKADDTFSVYEFVSEGPRGKIPKLVKYAETNIPGVFNLAFEDKDENTNEINDLVVSNNRDSEKVLATVVATAYAFTQQHSGCYIYATGSTKARTRLYRMGISKYLEEIKIDFEVYGLKEDQWQLFEKGIEYDAFLFQRLKKM
ncbi:MAG: hypothetical protein C0424_00545 [Sphingobacteriaceae bacterium]|nr:hypothetical protein [Sphingobacteriaceae bacterium]